MLRTSVLLQKKNKKGSNSVNNGNSLTVLVFCTFSDNPQLMYQASFNSLLYFKRDATDKLFIAKN